MISVLMPCYNAAEFIRESIDSVLNQTYSDFELILINDGSTDETQSIIDEYTSTNKIIRGITKENSGIPDTLNVGIEAAKGAWIARLDSDDIAMPNRFQMQIDYVGNHPEIILLGSGCIVIDEYGNEIKKYSYGETHQEIVRNMLRLKPFFPHSSALFFKNAAQKLGGYVTRFSEGEDLDLWLRISNTGAIACLPQSLIKLRKHANCVTVKKRKKYEIGGLAAVICDLRFKSGLTPPSKLDDDSWQEFLRWIERRLEINNHFSQISKWEEFKSNLYRDDINSFTRARLCLLNILRNPIFISNQLKTRIFGFSFPSKLAVESKLNWPN